MLPNDPLIAAVSLLLAALFGGLAVLALIGLPGGRR